MSTKHWMALSATGWGGCWIMFCLYLVASERADHKAAIAEHYQAMSEIYAQAAIQAATRAAAPAAVTHTTVLPPEVVRGY
jgi:hypothetical protein